jgi:RNA polymerase sigma-70 factor, ECF subfamily
VSATRRGARASGPADEELVSLLDNGSVAAFELLYDRYSTRAYRVAWSVCHDQGLAEDAVQEAFLSIWRTHGCYDSQRGSVVTWLLSTVRYRAIDLVRRDYRHASRRWDEHTLATHAEPEALADRVAQGDQAEGLRALLTKLPEPQREVITLAFYGELTHSEIALALGLPAGTVKGRMRLGLHKLRDALDGAAA